MSDQRPEEEIGELEDQTDRAMREARDAFNAKLSTEEGRADVLAATVWLMREVAGAIGVLSALKDRSGHLRDLSEAYAEFKKVSGLDVDPKHLQHWLDLFPEEG